MGFSPSASTTQKWLWVFRAGMGFILLASLLFLLGFFTKMWYDDHTVHYGLWKVCTGAVCEDVDSDDLPSYRIATQAFQCLAFAAYGLAPFLHYIFYCTKRHKGFGIRIRVFDITYGLGVLFHLASVVIYGLEQPQKNYFSWSYEMTAASVAISAIGLFLVAFSRKRALHDFSFCSHKGGKSKRNSRVGTTRDSGLSRGNRRSSRHPNHHHHNRDRQESPSGSSGNSQLVFGPRQPLDKLHKQQQQHYNHTPLPPAQPLPSHVNVTVHNHYAGYGGDVNQQQQQQQQQQLYPHAFSTQASGASPYPPQVQLDAFPPSHQPYAPHNPQGYYNGPHGKASASAPPYEQSEDSAYPPAGSTFFTQAQQKGTELPPLRGVSLNTSDGGDSFDSGKPPSYEDVLNRTTDGHYQ